MIDNVVAFDSYNGGDTGPVALLVSKCPLAPDINSFSIGKSVKVNHVPEPSFVNHSIFTQPRGSWLK